MKQIKVVQEAPDDFDVRELLVKCISFLRKYSLLIAGFFLAGLIAGILIYVRTPKQYSSSLLLQPVILTKSEQIKTINSLNSILEQQQFDELAARFNCHPSILKKLGVISAEDDGSESGSRSAFTVNIQVSDPAIVPTIQKGIIHALENGEFVKDKLAAQRASFKTMINVTANEISRLDSTRAAIDKNLMAPKAAAGSVIMDVSEINYATISLHEKLLTLKDSLNFAAAAHILQDFYIPTQSDKPKLAKTVGMGAAAGLVIGFLVAFCLFTLRSLKTVKPVTATNSTHNIPSVTSPRLKQAQTHS